MILTEFEQSKAWIFNLQVLAEAINRYFYYRCKKVIYFSYETPKHGCSMDSIILENEDYASYKSKMLLLDNRLINTEYKIIKKMIFSEIICSLYKIFEHGSGKFSLGQLLSVETQKDLIGTFLTKVGGLRNRVTQHHDDRVFFHEGYIAYSSYDFSSGELNFDGDKTIGEIILADDKTIWELVNEGIDLFVKLQKQDSRFTKDDEFVNNAEFINTKYCKLYIRRLKKNKCKINKNILSRLEIDLDIVCQKLTKLFNVSNTVFTNKKGNKIRGRVETKFSH
jgi:hypothetical protein